MFCPSCKDEFRTGFTRCANCDVDLVDDLDAVVAAATAGAVQHVPFAPVVMRDWRYFIDLDEVRQSRDRLAADGLGWEIAIRAAPDSAPGDPASEEYWLRVEPAAFAKAEQLLGPEDEADDAGPALFSCEKCGKLVSEDDTTCPHCGVSLDD